MEGGEESQACLKWFLSRQHPSAILPSCDKGWAGKSGIWRAQVCEARAANQMLSLSESTRGSAVGAWRGWALTPKSRPPRADLCALFLWLPGVRHPAARLPQRHFGQAAYRVLAPCALGQARELRGLRAIALLSPVPPAHAAA